MLPQISFSRLRSGFDYNSLLVNNEQDLDNVLLSGNVNGFNELGTSPNMLQSGPHSISRTINGVTPL